jgi:hypothetical protein
MFFEDFFNNLSENNHNQVRIQDFKG